MDSYDIRFWDINQENRQRHLSPLPGPLGGQRP